MCSLIYLLAASVGRRRCRWSPALRDENHLLRRHQRGLLLSTGHAMKMLFLVLLLLALPVSCLSSPSSSALSSSPLSSVSSVRNSVSPVAAKLKKSSFSPPLSYLQLEFTQSTYHASIPENSLGKVYVQAQEQMGIWVPPELQEEFGGSSSGNASIAAKLPLRFRIRSGDSEGFFKAEAEQVGDFVFLVIRTRTSNLNVLNRERRAEYTLDIRTKMKAKGSKAYLKLKEAKCIVHIRVLDTNDLDPFFSPSEYRFVVAEDMPLHHSIGRVQADDADEGINGEIYYSLINKGNSPPIFAVDPVTGVLSLTRPLDFRESPTHDVVVTASDRGVKPAYAVKQADTATVHIKVKQVNLHDPVIHVQHLPEVIEQSYADIYAILRVSDPDPDRHGEVASLEIIEGDPEAHFRIRPASSGSSSEFNVEVLKLLDREVSPYGYNLTLKAVDRGTPPRTYYKSMHVQLTDVNDHAPVFEREIYEVKVNESAPINTPLTRLKVSDDDYGRNAKVTLSIIAGNEDRQFRIDPVSGVLFVNRVLDAEHKSAYTLTIGALDHANTGMRKQSSAKIRIFVLDVNDNEPTFDSTSKQIYFNENEPPGTRVIRVNAKDADSGENGYVSYSIANLDRDELPFEINELTGVLKSTRLIDYETERREYRLLIRASDWGTPYRRQSELRLIIRIRDINDNRPQFERVDCEGIVPRSTSPGSPVLTLSALDFDAGDVISYRVVSGNADGCFGLDSTKGTVSVICNLRTLPTLVRQLNVTATDGTHFSDVMSVRMRLEADDDHGSNWHSRQSVWSAASSSNVEESTLFTCQETEVDQKLISALEASERSNQPVHDDVFSRASAVPKRYGSNNIHQPEFDRIRMPREIHVNETVKPGTVLLKALAHDRDFGFNGDLLYVISDGDTDSVFYLDTISGHLIVDGRLDRERTTDYMLNLTVLDQGVPQKSASRLLHVIVDDENDNAPTFVKSTFSFFFPENTRPGTPVVSLNATDVDAGLNGQITYSLETETDAFNLNPVSGLLTVGKQLDREYKEFYDLTIRATDSSPTAPLYSTAVVRVRVLDVNDVAPKFTAKEYFVKAREDLPIGSVVGMVHAYDPDLYQGGQIRFSLVQPSNVVVVKRDGEDVDNEHFAIDEISGTVRVKRKLDYEKRQLYNLTVKAADEGSPSHSSLASFVIEILDVNENYHAPRFDSFFTRTAVPENMAIGSRVATVVARDLDEPGSDDAKVSYNILGGDGLGSFYIDEEGTIKTLAVLDRESKPHYWLTVHAIDHGAVPLSSKLFVYVEVLNVNDNAPMTEDPVYFSSIPENSKANTPIISLTAVDADKADSGDINEVTFEIVAGNPQSLFQIDSKTGVISTTKRLLDREAQPEHVLEVLVNDNGKPPLNSTTKVIIAVTDVNDNKPEFLERYYKVSVPEVRVGDQADLLLNDQNPLETLPGANGSLSEVQLSVEEREDALWEELFENATWFATESTGKALFRSIAYDIDEGENSQLTYDMKSVYGGKFEIDPQSGIVYLAEGDALKAGGHYEMLIRVRDRDGANDKALSALSRISLTVDAAPSEKNEHPPTVAPVGESTVFESDPVGHFVAMVNAEDQDGDKLWYSIVGGDDANQFYMSPDRGSVLIADKLDWRQNAFYNLSVEISDGKHNIVSQVPIHVIGVDKGRPEFVSPTKRGYFEINVSENASIGTVILKLRVQEKEGIEDKSKKYSYSFYSARDPHSLKKFKIHPNNGNISIKEKLDAERVTQHVFTVSVKDQGTPSRTNYARVTINVQDHNDHEPKFLTDLIQTKLHETADLGTTVAEILAVDTDQGENGRISYSIASGNIGNTFTIDEDLGLIRVARELNMVKQGEYMLIVRATDHGHVQLSSTIPVHILLTMSDTAPPQFIKQHYATEVYENAPRGQFIIQAEARGRSALRYEIISGNTNDAFSINPSTGTVMTLRTLDFEECRFYNLTVQVSNTVGSKSACTVNIHVLDVNDNAPEFNATSFKGHVSETASIGSLVLVKSYSPLVIKATDKDVGINSLLYYKILDERAKKYFSIDESTGAIRTIMSLDYEEQSEYVFPVRVSDRGTPKLSSDVLAEVTITILDENDSPPRFVAEEYRQMLLVPTFRNVAVLQVNATDPDTVNDNEALTYSIVGGNDHGCFTIDGTSGIVRVAKEKEVAESPHYAIDIAVSDGKFSDKCLVYVSVEHSDNSGLVFAKSKYYANVLENSTKKSDVIEVVTVLGAALNENLHFSLLNPTDLFTIGSTSGAIRTTGKTFDREEQEKYELIVEVRSSDHNRVVPRVAHVVVEVQVLDINDNAPEFMNQPYHAVMSKATPKDASIIRVSAIDRDEGENGNIYYQLHKGNGELFRVGRKSGQITLRQQLDDYDKEYRLTIAVYDGGLPPLQAEVTVHIKVIDESVPVFSQQLYKASVKENMEAFSPIVSVQAESPHEQQDKLIYTIESGNEAQLFAIDYATGVVSVATGELDFENKAHHQLTVRATDGLNGGYAEAIVLIGIEDVNDCRPQFKNDSYAAVVSEAKPYGTHILTVKATDADSGKNSELEYSIKSSPSFSSYENPTKLFSIDPQTGEIALRRRLDHERAIEHHFMVIATDKGSPRPLSSSVCVTVTVLDTNDNAPEFEELEYVFPLSDRAKRGQFIGKARAVDPDLSDSSKLRYAIRGGNDNQVFSMNETTGILTLVNLHNFEQKPSYLLNISVTDGVYARNARARIVLISANSFAPKFDKSLYQVDFYENQPAGSLIARISATDEDRNDRATYKVVASSELAHDFRIDDITGEVWSLRPFDREEQDLYEIPIMATDIGGRSGFTALKVRITDVNDCKPIFALREYRANVPANMSLDKPILTVKAHDEDTGDNARLTYTIYENQTSEVSRSFSIDTTTGVISLKHSAETLENQIYQFFVRATDNGRDKQFHTQVPVEVYIMSPLDKVPMFEARDDTYYLSESSPVGTEIANMKAILVLVSDEESDFRRKRTLPSFMANDEAIDEDEEVIHYSIASSEYALDENEDPEDDDDEDDGKVGANFGPGSQRITKRNGLFILDEEGRLLVNGHLDREDKATHYVTLQAKTESSPSLIAYYDITIHILDVNDNAPQFSANPYEITVSEAVSPHTQLVHLQAKDADFGNHGEVRYSFSPKSLHLASLFSVDMHSGWLTTQDNMDFEKQQTYELEVVATDNGGDKALSATTKVLIRVVDANDSPTRFSQRYYSAAVNEGAFPGTIIFTLVTEDDDKEATTEKEFYIINGDPSGQFQIKKNGELYVTRKLDRESVSSYRLEVSVTDGTFVETCRVGIEILDDNDSPPICVKPLYRRQVEENSNSGTELATILAHDADEGANAKQKFYLTGKDADMFTIDSFTGLLKTALPLDRERVSSYHLEAHVQDAGNPEWECTSHVEVVVLDVNDNAPKWGLEVFSATLREDVPVGTVTTKLHATDADLGDNKRLRYSFVNSAKHHFRIDPVSGIVTLAKPLDREEKAMYNLTVKAMDFGRPRLSTVTNLIVLVLDVNDNPPEFASKYYFSSVSEDAEINSDVVRVLATSRDTGVNAEITYSIVGGNEHRKFRIDAKSGTIYVDGTLDHEQTPEYFLTIQAQDGGDPPLSNHATVNITVVDTNDNEPIFHRVAYSSIISESAQMGEHVATVTASDMDAGDNGRITYSILSGDRHQQFKINPESGEITVGSALDREMISNYVIEVQASDHGTPLAKSSTVHVNVDISDANDNPPIFPEGNYTCYVQEDKPIDYVVQRFTVTDADDIPNGAPFTFDIRAGNDANSFRVVQDGTLRTTTKFNHKIKNEYKLQIRVFDNGTPPLYTDSFVTVNIIEESQFAPDVVPTDVHIFSYQDDFPGALIAQVTATDKDPYDRLSYKIVPPYSPYTALPLQSHLFEIDSNEGTIIALQGLDVGSYSLNISVSDGKFTTYSPARVVVDMISDDMLEFGVIAHLANLNPREFILRFQKPFVKVVKNILDVRSKDVMIFGVQPAGMKHQKRTKREELLSNDLEVLFAVRKKSGSEFYPRSKILAALEKKSLPSQAAQIGVKILGLQQNLCELDSCDNNATCKDVVITNEGHEAMVSTMAEDVSFVAPSFRHKTICECREGFAGSRCETVLNECARQPCASFQVCVPDSSFQGYSCQCPKDMTGTLCNVNITECRANARRKCERIVNPMTFGGKSYAQYSLLRSVERHMSVSLSFKTLHATGNLMYAIGIVDFSILEIVNGRLRYRFNFGSGEGLVTLDEFIVNDGEWHDVRLERHGNSAKISLDGQFEEQGTAPGINDVLSLEQEASIYFGAEVSVHKTPTNGEDVLMGFSGCIDDIRLDGISLPQILNGESQVARLKRFNNIEFGCPAQLIPPGVCGSQPCQNGGTCQEQSGGYQCACPTRFTGHHCEYDLDPCSSNPCLHGAHCVNLKNDFHCECPPRLSGKRCHYGMHCNPNPCENGGLCEEGLTGPICKCRGFTGEFCTIDINECLHQNPCHNGGTCINSNGGFHCICPDNSTGLYCHDVVGGVRKTGTRDHLLKLEEVVGIIFSLFIIVIVVACVVCCKRVKLKQRMNVNGNGVVITNGRASGTYHIQNSFDKDENPILNHNRALENRREKLNNLELAAQERPLLSPPRPLSCYTPNHNQIVLQHQAETSFNYAEPVRSYGAAAEELEALPRLSHDYIQNIQKPMAAVAPSVQPPTTSTAMATTDGATALVQPDRNLMDHYFYPNKSRPSPVPGVPSGKLKLNTGAPTDSPALKGATSLSSLPVSVAEDSSQRYYWDSFDLNNDQGHQPLPKLSEVPTAVVESGSFVSGSSASNENNPLLSPSVVVNGSNGPSSSTVSPPTVPMATSHTSTLPPPGKPVDPTRDIQTLNEDEISVADVAGISEDDPPLGTVSFPPETVTKSFEELLALDGDELNFADDDNGDEAAMSPGREAPNSYDYHLHLNNYLPTYTMSETDTDEQTPMLGRNSRSANANGSALTPTSSVSPNANLPHKLPEKERRDADTSSEMNGSIAALPEEELGLKKTTLDNRTASSNGASNNICTLDTDSDGDETPTVEVKPMPPLAERGRVTRV